MRGRGGLAASQTRTVDVACRGDVAAVRAHGHGDDVVGGPLKLRSSSPEAVSQTRTVWSAEPVDDLALSGKYASEAPGRCARGSRRARPGPGIPDPNGLVASRRRRAAGRQG